MPHQGTGRTASELEWLRVNDYLRRNRYELAVRAADGYPVGARVAGTPLLAAPEWLPGTPIPLERVRLSLDPEAPQPRITATDIKTLAPALLPERSGGTPYRRHSDVIGELAAPAVYENRATYRLTGADLAGEDPHLGFTLGRFFDGIDVGGAAAHEYAAAELDPGKDRPLRTAIKDPCDLAARLHAMAVGALTLRHDRAAGTASFPLHWRDPRRVDHAGGLFQVIPVGIFQPSGEAEWNVTTDFSLWRGLLREYAEELLGADEDHGSETAPIDYESWPLARRMTRALGDGRIRAWCLGLGADPLTFAMDLLTVVVIDAPLYDELFGAAVTDNAEGTVLPLRSFDAPTVRELVGNHPVQAAGAALLTLALGHRDTLLAGLPGALLPAAFAPLPCGSRTLRPGGTSPQALSCLSCSQQGGRTCWAGTWPPTASPRPATRSTCCGATARRQPPTACTAPRQLSCWPRPRSCSADLNDEPGAGMSTPKVPQSWRVLGFGKHPENAVAIQARLRDAGLAATNFALTDDEAGDARLIQELTAADYDGVLIGGFINGQDPKDPPTEQRTRWFNRILNIIHAHAPAAKIILVRDPADALPAVGRVLGDSAPESPP